jgi:ribosomal protein L15E
VFLYYFYLLIISQPLDSGHNVSLTRSNTTLVLIELLSIDIVNNGKNNSVFRAPRTTTQQAAIALNTRPKRGYTQV